VSDHLGRTVRVTPDPYNPWRALRRAHDVQLHWKHLPGGARGMTRPPEPAVTLDPRQTQAELRSTLTHELVHLERGPVPADPVLAAREEAAVEQETAHRLIPLPRLADVLMAAHGEREAADELWVDVEVLRCRLAHLHPAERGYLRRRLAQREGAA